MKKADFDFLINTLKEQAGWDFSDENYYILDKKISNYVRDKNYANSEELIQELKLGSKALTAQLIEALAMSDTYFFRDCKVFSHFENTLLPYIRETNRATKKIRIWSLGCSSGQETYSIAIAVKNKFPGLNEWNIDILGTDLSSAAITKAQRGIYNNFEIQMGMNAGQIIDNFTFDKNMWQINDDIYRMVQFRRYNLLDDVTFTDKYEIIFCRNVLRFFTPEHQKKLLEKIFKSQTQGGFLYLGLNEQIEGLDKFYVKVPHLDCLYQAKNVQSLATKTTTPQPEEKQPSSDMPRFVRPKELSARAPLTAVSANHKDNN